MRKAQTPIRSIDRNYNTEGSCDFIVNLRPRGKWFPVGKKRKVMDILPGINHHHSVLPESDYINIQSGENAALTRQGSYQLIDTIKTWEPKISSVGNVLIVHTENDVHYYVYNGIYRKLPGVPNPVLLREKSVVRYNKVFNSTLTESLADMLSFFSRQDKFYRGNILITTAWELMDGNTIMHNQIIHDDLEYYNDPAFYQFMAGWGFQQITRQESTYPAILGRGAGFNDSEWYPINQFASKINIKCYFTENDIELLKLYSDVIIGLNVYAHYVPSTFNYSTNTDDYELKEVSSLSKGGPIINYYFPKRSFAASDFFQNIIFRKIHSFSLFDIKEGDHSFIVDLTNYDVQELLQVDNFSHHKLFSMNQPYVLNNSLYLTGVGTKFGGGNSQQFISNIDSKFYNFNNIPGVMLNHRWIRQITEIEAENRIFYAENRLYYRNYGHIVEHIILESFLSYPDRRARKIMLCNDDYSLIAVFDLKAHPNQNIAYNINHVNDKSGSLAQARVLTIKNGPLQRFQSNIFYQHNRLQVSEVNNPLVFPAKYSYSVNMSERINTCASVAEEVGSGQRGQFPLFIFTDSQIYLLQPGIDIMYQQIIPIHRIGVKSQVLSTGSSILFHAHDDLYLMSARGELINISDTLHQVPVKLNPDIPDQSFPDFLENSILFYDNINREFIVANSNQQFSYVYNITAKAWYMRSEYFSQSLIVNSLHYLVRNQELFSMQEDDNEILPFYIQTNALYFSTFAHKKLSRSILRGAIKTDSEIEFSIFSETNYNYLKSITTKRFKNSNKVELMIPRLANSAKSFIFVASGTLTADSFMQFFESIIEETLGKKIR